MRKFYKAGIVLAGLSLLGTSQAFATQACQTESPAGTFAPIYTCLNGTTTFPGTFVGTIGTATGDVDQIGSISLYNSGSGGAFVNSSVNPSIYSFYWAGGTLDITEKIGNNGLGDAINVALDSLASQSSTSPLSTINSIVIPFSSGPSAFYTLWDANLAGGYYAIDSSLVTGNTIDPNYQINFAVVSEPMNLSLFGVALLGLAGTGFARNRKQSLSASAI